MKRLLVVLCILSLALAGCSAPFSQRQDSEKPGQNDVNSFPFVYTEPISINEVKATLAEAGLSVTEKEIANINDYVLNDIYPTVLSITPQHIIYLYDFTSIAQRVDAGWSAGAGLLYLTDDFPLPENWLGRSFTARNILIIQTFNAENMITAKDPSPAQIDFQKSINAVEQAQFILNQGQEMVFADRGQLWDGQLTVKFFQHWYKDAGETSHVDQNSQGVWQVKYLGSNADAVQSLRYEYTTLSGSGSGDSHLQKDGEDYHLHLGPVYNTGIPTEDTVYTLQINCDGQTETLDMKKIRQ